MSVAVCCILRHSVAVSYEPGPVTLATEEAIPTNSLQLTATHCNSLQLTATHCNSLQLTATHCKELPTTYVSTSKVTTRHFAPQQYEMASISMLLKIIGLFCIRALQKRRHSAKKTYIFKEPANRSHPIVAEEVLLKKIRLHILEAREKIRMNPAP